MKYILLVLSLGVLISCCGTSKTQQPNNLVENQESMKPTGKYRLTNVEDITVTSEDAVLNFSDENRVSGIAGCNNFTADYSIDGETLNFSPVTATRMYCEGEMETEKAIFRVFSKTNKIVSASNDEIIFVSENGDELLRAKKIK